MLPTDLTVAALVENDGRFLIVEERCSGSMVITQPGGHIESGESPEDAAVRETLEEAAWDVEVRELLGVYLWIHPQSRQQFLRIMYVADHVREHPARALDEGIASVHWYTLDDIRRRKPKLRTPVVLRCIEDYMAGRRQPGASLKGLQPLNQNIHAILATASLV